MLSANRKSAKVLVLIIGTLLVVIYFIQRMALFIITAYYLTYGAIFQYRHNIIRKGLFEMLQDYTSSMHDLLVSSGVGEIEIKAVQINVPLLQIDKSLVTPVTSCCCNRFVD